MKASDYQTLFALMLDGAVARSMRGDQDALDLPASLMLPLRSTLPPAEWDKFLEGVELNRLEHEPRSESQATSSP